MQPKLNPLARTFRYEPNSQDTARYSVVPWSRIDIIVGNVAGAAPDRSQGVILPEIEGEGLFIERADYPVLMCPVVGSGPTEDSLVAARDGLMFNTPFKGLYLSHPLLVTTFATQPLRLSLIVFKLQGAVSNEYANPVTRSLVSSRAVTNTAIAQQWNLFVPPGARRLDFLRIAAIQTTITTDPLLTMVDSGGNPIVPVTVSQQIAAVVQTYNFAPTTVRAGQRSAGAGPLNLWDFQPLPLPTACRELAVSWAGTGLAAPVTIEGQWS